MRFLYPIDSLVRTGLLWLLVQLAACPIGLSYWRAYRPLLHLPTIAFGEAFVDPLLALLLIFSAELTERIALTHRFIKWIRKPTNLSYAKQLNPQKTPLSAAANADLGVRGSSSLLLLLVQCSPLP